MKKFVSVLMACMLAAAPCTAAFAEENETAEAAETTEASGYEETYKVMGITVNYPELFSSLKGLFMPSPYGDLTDGVWLGQFYYVAMTPEEYQEKVNAESLTEEEQQAVKNAVFEIGEVYAFRNDISPEDLMGEGALDALSEFGKSDNYTFYYVENTDTEAYLSGIAPEFAEEFGAVSEGLKEVLNNAVCFDPVAFGSELVGSGFSFETTDKDGNTVKSEDLFAEHDVTMVNIWATTCGACIGEMSELAEMNHRYEEKGGAAAVVGLCVDADKHPDDFNGILEEYGADYLNLVPFEGMSDMFPTMGWPTSYFIGKDGTLLAPPMTGAPSDMSVYENIIDKLLGGETVTDDDVNDGSSVHTNDAGVYRVHVTNADGDPVEGVMVQFCSDTACMMGNTDADGYVNYEVDEGTYTVHILMVPDGYEEVSEEFKTEDTFSDVCVVLQKAE